MANEPLASTKATRTAENKRKLLMDASETRSLPAYEMIALFMLCGGDGFP